MRKLLLAALAAASVSGTAQAGFIGDQVSGAWLISNTTVATFGPAIVGAGVEFTGLSPVSGFSIDISDDAVVVRNNCGGCGAAVFGTQAFNGYKLTNLTAPWPAFSITAALPGFEASDVTVTGSDLFPNLAGVSFTDGGFVRVTAVAAAVPAPGALPLLAVALGGLGLAMRRRAA